MKCFLVAMLSGIEQARDMSSLRTRKRCVPHVSVNLNLLLNVFVIRCAVRMTVCEELVWANGACRTFDKLAWEINLSDFDIFAQSYDVHPCTFGLNNHLWNDFTEYPSMQNFIRYCTLAESRKIILDNKKQFVSINKRRRVLLKKEHRNVNVVVLMLSSIINFVKMHIFADLLNGHKALRTFSIKLFAEKYLDSNNFRFSVLSCFFIVYFYHDKNLLTLICYYKKEGKLDRINTKSTVVNRNIQVFNPQF